MLIDLSLCASCGACALACKAENNTRNRAAGQSFNWADFIQRTEGKFPNTTQTVIPVMCNHCENPACVEACPTGAMYITPEGVVMHNDETCIGCRRCQKACPYSSMELGEESLEGATYSVISFNPRGSDPRGDAIERPEMIPGCSGSAAEMEKKLGVVPGYFNAFKQGDVASQRKDGVVEKCTLCYHRISNGQNPACVDACPAKCRIFGDLDDPNSEISLRLKGQKAMRLKEEKGTRPKVFYVGRFSAR
jgi:Fe-S-cluster-containing dehydrogenase component